MEVLRLAFILLVVYQFKHFIADYLLQGKYMLKKFAAGWDFALPLAAHCGVHVLFDLGILAAIGRLDIWWVALVDFAVHFVMDRIKASPKMLGRFKALSGREMNVLLSLGQVWAGDPADAPIPSVTPQGEVWRQNEFRDNKYFWWSLGLDQTVHHLTDIWIVWMIVHG